MGGLRGEGKDLDAHAAETEHDELAGRGGVENAGAFETEAPGVETLLPTWVDAVKGDMPRCVHLFEILPFRDPPVSGYSRTGPGPGWFT